MLFNFYIKRVEFLKIRNKFKMSGSIKNTKSFKNSYNFDYI